MKTSAGLFHFFKPVVVRQEEKEDGQCNYGKTMFKKCIGSGNKINVFVVIAVSSEDVRQMNLVFSSGPKGQGRKKQ